MLALIYVDHVGSDWFSVYVHGRKIYEGHPDLDTQLLEMIGMTAHSTVDDNLGNMHPTGDAPDEQITLAWSDYVGSDRYALYRGAQLLYTGDPLDPVELCVKLGIDHVVGTVSRTTLVDQQRMRGMSDTLLIVSLAA